MTTAYPLSWPQGWPRLPVGKRSVNSPFRTSLDKARREIIAELGRLGAAHVVISSNVPLRRDGEISGHAARARIDDPGVAVYFTLRGRPMVMARDAYWDIAANLRSIGHAVAHLRGLERHGGATMMERAFEGFAALPGPKPKTCWDILGLTPTASREEIETAYRVRAKLAHPDLSGSHEAMSALNAAREEALRG